MDPLLSVQSEGNYLEEKKKAMFFQSLIYKIDALHARRLLNAEKRPFDRINKRLMTQSAVLTTKLPTPPPDSGPESNQNDLAKERQQFSEDIRLDFAAFESSIVRAQFLLNSNIQERERYAEEKLRIQAAAQEVGDNIGQLRSQLEDAKNKLALRKTYDELTEKITSNRMLRPRTDQHINIEKLNNEIAELEQESRDYAKTWAERRIQFNKIIDEAMQLRRIIRDEKEEVERREGMEDGEDIDEAEAASFRGRASAVGTPRPEAGGATPLHPGIDGTERPINTREKSPLRGATPRLEVTTPQPEENDIQMADDAEDGEVSGDEGVASESDGLVDDSQSRNGDNMDTS
jgi:hypothetical protein